MTLFGIYFLFLQGCEREQSEVNNQGEALPPSFHRFISLNQAVEASLEADNNFAWVSKFSYQLKKELLVVTVRISVLPVEEIRSVRLENVKRQWLKEIDKSWNNRFSLLVSEKLKYPIKFIVKFSPINPDHKVVVRRGRSANQHNWTIDMPPAAAAHEFGHMIGAFDEYPSGALVFDSPVIDRSSIMGSRLDGGKPYPRHLSVLLNHIQIQAGDNSIQIISND